MTSKYLILMICLLLANAYLPTDAYKYTEKLQIFGVQIQDTALKSTTVQQTIDLRGGSIFAGYHPLGYGITQLGLQYLEFDGSLDSDVGRFLAGFKSGRKRQSVAKEQWLEIVRVSKTGQSMRIYRKLDELIAFCVKAGFLS